MKTLMISIKAFILFTILTGFFYPILITGVGQLLFPVKSNGSIVTKNGKKTGSALIGQKFDSLAYFFTRPSHVSYNLMPSGGSNFGLTNQKLRDIVFERRNMFISVNCLDTLTEVPTEMIFASASGLDPHISPQAAILQADRIGKYRMFSPDQQQKLLNLINFLTEKPQFNFLGEERINVFLLNLSLDSIK